MYFTYIYDKKICFSEQLCETDPCVYVNLFYLFLAPYTIDVNVIIKNMEMASPNIYYQYEKSKVAR